MSTKVSFHKVNNEPSEYADGGLYFIEKNNSQKMMIGVSGGGQVVGAPLEKGSANGSIQQSDATYEDVNVAGAKAVGFQSVAFGGMRPDKLDDADRSATSAEGIQSFAVGGCAHAHGDYSIAIGKDVNAYMRGSIVLGGGGTEAGMTIAEFNDKFATNDQKNLPGYDRTKLNGGLDIHIVDNSKEHYEYPYSYSLAIAGGQNSMAKGRVSMAFGNGNAAYGWYSAVFNNLNTVHGEGSSAFNRENQVYDNNSVAFGYNNFIRNANTSEGGTFVSGYKNSVYGGIYNHVEGGTNYVYDGNWTHVEGSDNVQHNGNQAHVGGKANINYSLRTVVYGYNNAVGNNTGVVDYSTAPTSPLNRTFLDISHEGSSHNSIAGLSGYSHVTGLGNEVYARNVTVSGVQNYCDADNCFIHGYRNLVRASSTTSVQTDLFYTTVFGGTNYVHGNGRYSFAAGSDNELYGNQSAAIGKQNIVGHQRAVALNAFNVTGREAQTVVGTYNSSSSTAYFVVGNGTSNGNRKNAFTVNTNGTATIQTAPINSMDVTNKKYVDDLIAQLSQRITALGG